MNSGKCRSTTRLSGLRERRATGKRDDPIRFNAVENQQEGTKAKAPADRSLAPGLARLSPGAPPERRLRTVINVGTHDPLRFPSGQDYIPCAVETKYDK
jgi:hypothetical protein